MFSEDYQKELLLRLTDKALLAEVGGLMEISWFSPEYEPLVGKILETWKKRKKVLTVAQLRQAAQRLKIKLPAKVSGDFEFDKEEVMRFAQHQVVKDAIYEVHELCTEGKFEECFDRFSRYRNQMPGRKTKHEVDVLKNLGEMPMRQGLVRTNLKTLDDAFGGGIAEGDLAMVMATTGGGKTTFLCWVAVQALLQGEDVLYVTLEVPHTEIEAKVRRCLTMNANPTKAQWKKRVKALEKSKGRIRIQEYPPKTVSPGDFLKELDGATVLIVDYADYLKPPSGRRAGIEYQELGDIYEELKQLSLGSRIRVWTASQAHREAYGGDVIDLQHTSGSLRKPQIVDQSISVNHKTVSGNQAHAEIFVSKNRHGRKGETINVTIDWPTSAIEEGYWEHG